MGCTGGSEANRIRGESRAVVAENRRLVYKAELHFALYGLRQGLVSRGLRSQARCLCYGAFSNTPIPEFFLQLSQGKYWPFMVI